jgi:hypothetical protein
VVLFERGWGLNWGFGKRRTDKAMKKDRVRASRGDRADLGRSGLRPYRSNGER